MTPKRSAKELFNFHKRTRMTTWAPPQGPPGSSNGSSPTDSPHVAGIESSIAWFKGEAMEDFKRSLEFRDLVAAAKVRGLMEGFYACRGWINFHYPLLDLSHYTFSLIPRKFCHPPLWYLEEAEATLERRAFEEVAQKKDRLIMPDNKEEDV